LLVETLGRQAKQGKLAAGGEAALLLIADLQAHLIFALETAAFLRAGDRGNARALEAALADGVWGQLDPGVGHLYETLRDHYLGLRMDLTASELKAWAGEALVFLADAVREKKLHVRLDLVRAHPRRAPLAQPRPEAPALRDGPSAGTGGMP
jgi:hypothetical protein